MNTNDGIAYRNKNEPLTSRSGGLLYEEWVCGPFRPVVRTSSFHVEDTGSIPVGDSTHSRPGRHIHCGVIARSVGWSSLRLFDRSAGWKRGSLPLSLQARREPLLRSIHSSDDVPALSLRRPCMRSFSPPPPPYISFVRPRAFVACAFSFC